MDGTCLISLFFFFQAEDGIRDGHVTGVQTCALPICVRLRAADGPARGRPAACRPLQSSAQSSPTAVSRVLFAACRGTRSEERRVGKEWRSLWGAEHCERVYSEGVGSVGANGSGECTV